MFKSKRKKQKKETAPKIPKTLSDSIPYERVYKNGVIEIQSCVFSKSYILPSVNYKTRGNRVQGSMAELYAEMIGSFDPDITVEITIYNKTIDIMEFQESILLKPNRDGLDKYRIEYNNMLIDKMIGAKNNLESQKIITISFYATDIESANERFQQVESSMAEYLTDLTKKDMKEMSLIERLDMLNSIYNQNSDAHLYEKRMIDGKEVESFSLENCEAQGITTKDVIAPGGMEITNDQINMDGVIAKSYYISNYPTWLKDTILTDFASIPTNMLVSVYFNTIAQEEAIKLVRRQGTNIRSEIVNIQKRAARSGYDASLINPDVQDSQREVGEMANDITKENRKLFVANIVITLFASSKEELENYEKQLKALQTKHMVTVKQLYLQQEAGFNTALPLGNNQLEIQRLMSSDKDILKEVDGGMFAASKYTELTLAMIEVLSQGGQGYQGIPFERDPAHVGQYFDPSVKNSITQEKSIEKLVARYFAAEDAHSGQSDFASIYKSDDALMAVVQGVMFGSDYSKNNSKYTKENSQAFYNAKKASFDAKGVAPDSLFALAVKQRYSTVNIGGSGSITGGSGYVQWMINFAADDTHGYSMANRCMNPDVDCSSFVYYGLRYGAGYGTNLLGASPFSTYTMDSALKKSGFARLPRPASINDLHVGDILWCTDHTEVYVGNGKDVGAHSNKDGRPGDSSGREVSVSSCNYMFKRCTAIYRK